MRRNASGLAVGLLLFLVPVCLATEWISGPEGCAVPTVPPPQPREVGHTCHRLWDWLTYHSKRTPCCWTGCSECRRPCAPICRPHLYEYFLWERQAYCNPR
jgi:hypothetical protein